MIRNFVYKKGNSLFTVGFYGSDICSKALTDSNAEESSAAATVLNKTFNDDNRKCITCRKVKLTKSNDRKGKCKYIEFGDPFHMSYNEIINSEQLPCQCSDCLYMNVYKPEYGKIERCTCTQGNGYGNITDFPPKCLLFRSKDDPYNKEPCDDNIVKEYLLNVLADYDIHENNIKKKANDLYCVGRMGGELEENDFKILFPKMNDNVIVARDYLAYLDIKIEYHEFHKKAFCVFGDEFDYSFYRHELINGSEYTAIIIPNEDRCILLHCESIYVFQSSVCINSGLKLYDYSHHCLW